MIVSFETKQLEAIFRGENPGKGFPADLVRVTARKLEMMAAAHVLQDLKAPPSNRLEALRGGRAGQHSIRVNDQFRICFVWTPAGPSNVEFADYH